jgi:hypothetical protein
MKMQILYRILYRKIGYSCIMLDTDLYNAALKRLSGQPYKNITFQK